MDFKENILKLIEEQNLNTFNLLKKHFNDDVKTFVLLNKTLNMMVDEQMLYFVEPFYYSFRKVCKTRISVFDGEYYLNDEKIKLDVANFKICDKDLLILEKIQEGHFKVLNICERYLTKVIGYFKRYRNKSIFRIIYPNTKEIFYLKDKNEIDYKAIYEATVIDYQKNYISDIRKLGFEDDLKFRMNLILKNYEVTSNFNKSVYSEINNFVYDIDEKNYPDYSVLTNDYFITIDGFDAKDFDDAIYLKKIDEGYILKVAISDVSSYVKKDGFLDKEAFKRGTSIYFLNTVIPMLPFELSNGLCSLVPLENRLALVLSIKYDERANVLDYQLEKAIIKSKRRLTYDEANDFLRSDSKDSLVKMLKKMAQLSSLIRLKRERNGCISFEENEYKFVLENNKVTQVLKRVRYDAEKMIEDFMIEANSLIAEIMYHQQLPMIYRNHLEPKIHELKTYLSLVESLGYSFKKNQNYLDASMLAKSLEYFSQDDNYEILSDLLLRSMNKALYEANLQGHFALGLKYYCHFTSPIRRYPDLIVHRYLHQYILDKNYDEYDFDLKNAEEISKICNKTEKSSIEIERSMDNLAFCFYLAPKLKQVFEAKIVASLDFGIFVRLECGAKGLIHIKYLDAYFDYENNILVSKQFDLGLGKTIKVILKEVDLFNMRIDFVPLKTVRGYNKDNEKKYKRYRH